jgi:hypothetical protein
VETRDEEQGRYERGRWMHSSECNQRASTQKDLWHSAPNRLGRVKGGWHSERIPRGFVKTLATGHHPKSVPRWRLFRPSAVESSGRNLRVLVTGDDWLEARQGPWSSDHGKASFGWCVRGQKPSGRWLIRARDPGNEPRFGTAMVASSSEALRGVSRDAKAH